MKILVFDTNPGRRAAHVQGCGFGGHDIFAYQGGSAGLGIHALNGVTWVADPAKQFDLVLLHDGNYDAFIELGLTAEQCLRYSQGGTIDGVPWSVSAQNPLDPNLLQQIIGVAAKIKSQPVAGLTGQAVNEQWLEEVRKLWAGIPECLLAWALCEHVGRHEEAQTIPIADVKAAFERLKASVMADPEKAPALQHVGWADEVIARLVATKNLIQAARRDL